MLNPNDVLASRYEIISKIGQGGMSIVYKAVDLKLGRNVALKMLKDEFANDEEYIHNFMTEAKTSACFVNRNVVCTYDVIDDGDVHCMIMEFVEGTTLKYYIRNKTSLTNEETIQIALQTAEGLAEAHKAGVIHRDVKPQNIIISKDGLVKVADFGIAKPTEEEKEGDVLGSVHYISPEQAAKGKVDNRSDIYSLGITMYEMITGKLPFDSEKTDEVLDAHMGGAVVPPNIYKKDIYPALEAIILKCIRKDPEERYQSTDELVADLKKCLEDPEGHFVHFYGAEEKTEGPKEVKSRKRPGRPTDEITRSSITAAICVLLLIGIVLFFSFASKRVKETPIGETYTEHTTEESQETDYNIVIEEEETIPAIVGLSMEDAKKVLNGTMMGIAVEDKVYNDSYSANVIISQDPAEGSQIKPGQSVRVIVSKGSEVEAVVASIYGMSVEEATAALTGVEINIKGTKKQFSDDVETGRVTGCLLVTDAAGTEKTDSENAENEFDDTEEIRKINRGSDVILLVSAGKETDGAMIPNLIGLSYSDAVLALTTNSLQIGSVSMVPDANAPKGAVTNQSQPAGDLVKKGTVINVQINLEPHEQIDMTSDPNVYYNVDPDSELSPLFYYASIDQIVEVGGPAGPNNDYSVKMGIRLVQRVNNATEYSIISEPRPYAGSTRIPVCFKNIRGAFGVETGTLEVFDADTDNVIASYELHFAPMG
ncbi:MAG: protein kinase [Eubacteriales bacterium]|nr:protein kinase [Eubacteriales bacterium]